MDLERSGSKREVIEKLLEEGMVLITLDARAAGVRVPSHLGGDPQLRLNLSHRFGLPMESDDDGISATLTFAGEPFACRIPWSTIYLAMAHGSAEPVLFPADIPADGGTRPGHAVRAKAPRDRDAKTPQGAGLRVVAAPAAPTDGTDPAPTDAESNADPESDASGDSQRSRRSHLRVVK